MKDPDDPLFNEFAKEVCDSIKQTRVSAQADADAIFTDMEIESAVNQLMK